MIKNVPLGEVTQFPPIQRALVADALTELHEVGGVQFKVVPIDEKAEKDWIQGAVKRPGAFTKKAKAAGMSVQQFAKHGDDNKSKYSTRTERQANLAQTFASMKKEDVEEQIFNYIVESTWYEFIDEGYQRNPEKGEAEVKR